MRRGGACRAHFVLFREVLLDGPPLALNERQRRLDDARLAFDQRDGRGRLGQARVLNEDDRGLIPGGGGGRRPLTWR